MKTRIGDITFDALNPRLMAEFWAEVLHYEVREIGNDLAVTADPAGRSPRCCFQRVDTPKVGKNRVHLDLYAGDMKAEVERIVGLGARMVAERENEGVVWTVMLDVEGNEFCVQPPQS